MTCCQQGDALFPCLAVAEEKASPLRKYSRSVRGRGPAALSAASSTRKTLNQQPLDGSNKGKRRSAYSSGQKRIRHERYTGTNMIFTATFMLGAILGCC